MSAEIYRLPPTESQTVKSLLLPRLLVLLGAVAVAGLATVSSQAATVVVDSLPALQAAINAATAGDTITVKNGSYPASLTLTVKCAGTADHPITIAAESVGGVGIIGSHGFNVTAPAEYVTVSGFLFTHLAGRCTIGLDTRHVRFTRNVFSCPGDGAFLSVSGNDAEIDHNEFRDKQTPGSMIAIGGVGSQVARRLWIHHNYFHDLTTPGTNTAEMIRFGLSAFGLSTGAGLVEHNLFAACRGENETISNRSSGNTYRYNTLLDSPTSQFTLRHGHDCLVYGNIFRNTEGLRIFGDRHQIFSNYFEGNYIGINLGNGSTEVAEGGSLTGHDRPDDCVIVFNTLVDNRTHYQMSRRTPGGLGATNTTFANNILQGGGVAAKIEGPYPGAVWSDNLVWATASAGDFPPEGAAKQDPLLVADSDGIKRPQPDSPAIGSATGSFPIVSVDLDGQPRPEKKSKGADEPGAESITARILAVADVGPNSK
jgi:poly(beta-D-mannuronate) lyase